MKTSRSRAPKALKARKWIVRTRHELTLPNADLCITGSLMQQSLLDCKSLQPWARFEYPYCGAEQSLDAPRSIPTGGVHKYVTDYSGTVYHYLSHSADRP